MIIKRDGRAVPFRRDKISSAVFRAAVACGGRDREESERVTDDVIALLSAQQRRASWPTVEEIQDLVEKALIERGHARVAKAYIVYRYEHALKRACRESLTYSEENIPYRKLWEALSWASDHGGSSSGDAATDHYQVEASAIFGRFRQAERVAAESGQRRQLIGRREAEVR